MPRECKWCGCEASYGKLCHCGRNLPCPRRIECLACGTPNEVGRLFCWQCDRRIAEGPVEFHPRITGIDHQRSQSVVLRDTIKKAQP